VPADNTGVAARCRPLKKRRGHRIIKAHAASLQRLASQPGKQKTVFVAESKDRALPRGLGATLRGGFLLVILSGVLGFSGTGRATRASASDTQDYVYTDQAEKAEHKWEAEEAAGGGEALRSVLRALPGGADLRAQYEQAARQRVLREACRRAAAWAREGRPLCVSVNLSARQLGERGLVPSVRAALDAAGLDLELTETALTETALTETALTENLAGKDREKGETVVDRLAALRALGIRLSVDDFGTGYSSLSYLRRLPLDVLKVDRSFVLGLGAEKQGGRREDEAVVRAIIAMAHALSLEVIAEGVEREEQRRTLARLGCDQMQGFLFSPAIPAERLGEMLEEMPPSERERAMAA